MIGYSGYAYVVYDCFFSQGQIITAYAAQEEKKENPFGLRYLGSTQEEKVQKELVGFDYFVAIADNTQRKQITEVLIPLLGPPVIALHKTAVLSRNMNSGEGVMIGPRAIVNSGASLGNGVILQSACIVDHESRIGHYVHIGAGAVLCGRTVVGDHTHIGAHAVIAEGVKIGANVWIADGAVVRADVPDGARVD